MLQRNSSSGSEEMAWNFMENRFQLSAMSNGRAEIMVSTIKQAAMESGQDEGIQWAQVVLPVLN